MRTILVTGGAGYIGSHTCKALAQRGYTPVVYDNLSEGHREFVRWGDFFAGDTRDGERLGEVFKQVRPDAVIHFAASAYVGESMRDPQTYYENNVTGSLSLLSAMNEVGCRRFVFSSTCAVYGEVEVLPINLETATRPINPYGRSKLMVEQVLNDVCRAHQVDSVALRYFNAAGADSDGELGEWHEPETHLIPNAINAALGASSALKVFGYDYPTADGTCVRDYIHVADLAAGHVAALEYMDREAGNHVFNLGSGHGVSIRQVLDEIALQLGVPVPHDYAARRPGDPPELTADISVSQRELGWTPSHSELPNIISTALNWARSGVASYS